MPQSNNILQELRELKSTLANEAPQNTYTVPDGYFESLANLVLSRIRTNAGSATEEIHQLSPMLAGISRVMPFSVPAGYFEELEVSAAVPMHAENEPTSAQEELERLSPLLSGLNKEVPYSVPQGYFETVRHSQTRPQAPVISMGRKWLRYAAAASVIGLIALAGLMVVNRANNSEIALRKFEKRLDKELKNTSDKELAEFVQQFTDAGLTRDEKVLVDPKEEINELLKDVPDTELRKFLEETSDPGTATDLLMN